jgi:uncharacterized membrane protein YphA (DoxX/SURF4 family)
MDALRLERPAAAQQSELRSELMATAGAVIAAILFMRLSFGLWFLWHEAIEKLLHWTPETLPRLFGTWAENPEGYAFYQAFLTNVAAPNAEFFRYLVTGWELVFSICLLLGLGLRVLIPLQIFANLNYILGKTYGSGAANLDRLTLIIMITLFIVSAGRYYGVDRYLRERFPRLSWL